MKKIITNMLFILLLAGWSNMSKAQTTCATAINFGTRDTIVSGTTLTDSVRWYSFQAQTDKVELFVSADNTNQPSLKIDLYNGTCCTFAVLQSNTGTSNAILFKNSLTIGTTYYVKMKVINSGALPLSNYNFSVKSGGQSIHTLFLCKATGNVFSCGSASSNALGFGPGQTSLTVPTIIPSLSNIV